MVLKEKILIREDNNGICNLIFNRPSAHNALSFQLLSSIKDEINLIKEDKRIRVLIISANGPSFCSGHDLKEINSNNNKNFGEVKNVYIKSKPNNSKYGP